MGYGMKKKQVNVYRNLHKKGMFSIRLGGKVIDWASTIILSGNISFHIGEKARIRVTKQRKKNVHSFIKSDNYRIADDIKLSSDYKELWYNPYFTQHYYCLTSGGIVVCADEVVLTNDRAFALNPIYLS